MIALIALFALALVVGAVGALWVVGVSVVRAAHIGRQRRRTRNDAHINSRVLDPGVSLEDAEFQRIVNQEWPQA